MAEAPIYLDFNATTPIDPDVAEAMRPWLFERFGNPSSTHAYGVAARQAVDAARDEIAGLLGCAPDEIVFTSGGTESNNLALDGLVAARGGRGHLVTSAIEHPSVAEPCREFEARGVAVTRLAVDSRGLVDPSELAAALTPNTIAISVMHANNEVGTIEPIAELSAIARRAGVPFHTDAAQSVGKVPTGVDALGIDLLTLAGHKLGAPQGVGALYCRRGLGFAPPHRGGAQERGLRSGTESVMLIVGLGRACAVAAREMEGRSAHARRMRDRLWLGLERELGGLRRNGDAERGLPNTLSVSIRGLAADALLRRLDGIAASAGSACHSGTTRISAVLAAMGVPAEEARGTVRFSTGWRTTDDEIDRAIVRIAEAARWLRTRTRDRART